MLRNPTAEPFDGHFDYCRVIGKLNYLEKCTRINVTCARFVSKPKDVHGKAVKWIGRYLAGTKDKGIVMKPDTSKGFEVGVSTPRNTPDCEFTKPNNSTNNSTAIV